jgi:DNA modification methylase
MTGAPEVRAFRCEDLKPYENNARVHSARQIEELRSAISRFGFNAPIAVWQGGVILAGHGRVEAAIAEGITEVPGVDLAHMSFNEARAFCLSDNRITDLAIWDDEKLSAELAALRGEDVDLTGLGFSERQLAALLAEVDPPAVPSAAPGATPPSAVSPGGEQGELLVKDPLIGSPVASEGELWTMGDHVLVVGSCTEPENAVRACRGQLVDMLLTDPPYGVDYGAKNRSMNERVGKGANETDIANDALNLEELRAFLVPAFASAEQVLRPGAAVYAFSAPGPFQHPVFLALRDAGLPVAGKIMWVKDQIVLSRADINYMHEALHFGSKPGAVSDWYGPENETSVWECPKPRSSKAHPTMKPIALLERAIRNSSQAGDLVLDIFGGSGSTMVAAHRRGRRSALVELSPGFADVILRRAIHECGLEPVREDGASFEEIEAARQEAVAA